MCLGGAGREAATLLVAPASGRIVRIGVELAPDHSIPQVKPHIAAVVYPQAAGVPGARDRTVSFGEESELVAIGVRQEELPPAGTVLSWLGGRREAVGEYGSVVVVYVVDLEV